MRYLFRIRPHPLAVEGEPVLLEGMARYRLTGLHGGGLIVDTHFHGPHDLLDGLAQEERGQRLCGWIVRAMADGCRRDEASADSWAWTAACGEKGLAMLWDMDEIAHKETKGSKPELCEVEATTDAGTTTLAWPYPLELRDLEIQAQCEASVSRLERALPDTAPLAPRRGGVRM